MKKDLLKELKLQKYSSKKKDRLAFKAIVNKLEKKNYKITRPGYKILKKQKKACVITKYMIAVTEKKRFRLIKFNLKLIKNQIKKCKSKELIVFLHIRNKVNKNKHLNLLILNLKTKKVTRIDPSSPIRTKITIKKVKKELVPFFKKIGFQFTGYDDRSKVIKHGKLCRYAAPAEYIYGKKTNYKILKKVIIDYFKK